MGDLNTRADDPMLQRLLAARGVINVLAAKESLDRRAESHIDWILARGLTPIRAELRDDGASDHPFARAELVPIQRMKARLIQDEAD